MLVANLAFVYAQNSNFHIPKYKKMEGDTLVHHKGYSALFNTNYKVSRWIAYTLKKEHLGFDKCENPKDFKADPKIIMQNEIHIDDFVKNEFSLENYEIGHLAKYCHLNYDNIVRREANYFTNLTPQNSNNNRSLWNKAEKFTERVVDSFNDVNIINGCIFDSIPNIKSNVIPKPDKYFMILQVKYKNDYNYIAFIIPNEENEVSFFLDDFRTSIYEIENKTKLYFFPNVDKKIQEKIKSEKNSNFWDDFFR